MSEFQTFSHPYLGIYTKCFLWQTENYNIWIDTGLRPAWEEQKEILSDGRKNVLLMTHGHWDHIGGIALIRQHGGIVYAHEADRRHLTDLEWHWQLLFGQFEKDFDLPPARKTVFWESVEAPSDLDRAVSDGDVLNFDQLRFRCIGLPGHSGGSVCYLEETTGTLFTGDGVMGNGFFTGTPQIENYESYIQSMQHLKTVSVDRVITDHTDVVPGKDLSRLAQASIDAAERLLKAVRIYTDKTAGNVLTVGDAAKAIAQAEGKNVGGGTCVSAVAALRHMTDDPRAQKCAERYLFGD